MNFGFVIDNRNCIGCHACSTACKSENDVPLGVYRTWVRTVETGSFPDTQRHFQVTRCNHCSNPPCVRICPTGAMFQRADGIVEFDSRNCIGCKACMQACPYDAIYIDPETNTAAKCHYCAHRTDRGLEPACVVVCPTHAILAGDMDDPASEISQVLSREKVSVRKPEQGTAPKLFYIEGSAVNLHPTAVGEPASLMFTDVQEDGSLRRSSSGDSRPAMSSKPQAQGLPSGGPIQIGGRQAGHMVQMAYNAQHKLPWHWPVPAYLVTKGISSGLFVLVAMALLSGIELGPDLGLASGLVSLLFLGVTTGLLVFDLERPERFLYILTRPQWRSWLTRGAVLLIGFSLTLGVWTGLQALRWLDLLAAGQLAGLESVMLWLSIPLAVGVAVYTAFLFGQAEGRDLWQSPLSPFHLVVQAAAMGGASLIALGMVVSLSPELASLARNVLALSLVADLALILLGELGMSHATEVAARAARSIHSGRYKTLFWLGAMGMGHLVPLALLFAPISAGPLVGALCAAFGLYLYEYAWVMAPQEVPNS